MKSALFTPLLCAVVGCAAGPFEPQGPRPEQVEGPLDVAVVMSSGRAAPPLCWRYGVRANHEYLLTHYDSGLRDFDRVLSRHAGGAVVRAFGYATSNGDHYSPVTGRVERGLPALIHDLRQLAARPQRPVVVLIDHSHGAITARRAIRAAGGVDVLVDLDAAAWLYASDWGDDGRDYKVRLRSGEVIGLQNWVPSSVAYNAELRASGITAFDRVDNRRTSGSRAHIHAATVPFGHAAMWRRGTGIAEKIVEGMAKSGAMDHIKQVSRNRGR